MLLVSPTVAQKLKVTDVKLLQLDMDAIKKPEYGFSGDTAALLKVYADNVTGLVFASDFAFKTTEYPNGYYEVYVASGIQGIEIHHQYYQNVSVNFRKDYLLSIEGGKTYRIDVKAEGMVQKKTETVVFNMSPLKGIIRVNGQKHVLSDGLLQIECDPGFYTYTAESNYHQTIGGTFRVSNIDKPRKIHIELPPQTAEVNFTCNAKHAVLYVDQENQGGVGVKTLPMGTHKIRVVADNWNDYTTTLLIKPRTKLNVTMTAKSYLPIVVRVTGTTEASLYVDNKLIPNWQNGKPFKVKQGKHLITAENEKSKTKDKVVTVRADMDPIVISFW